jgi:uncharacterized membrane protein YhaH (DUF805 family)
MQGFLPFHRYFDFDGRSSRAEFWQYLAVTTVLGWITGIADALNSTPYNPSHRFTIFLALGTIIPTIAVGIRRFHDREKSGWYYGAEFILAAVTYGVLYLGNEAQRRSGDTTFTAIGVALLAVLIGYSIYIVVQLAKPGDEHRNFYGPVPEVATSIFGRPDPSAKDVPAARPLARRPAPAVDSIAQIERLAQLRDAGTLTDEEFAAQKAVYLAQLK